MASYQVWPINRCAEWTMQDASESQAGGGEAQAVAAQGCDARTTEATNGFEPV